MHIEPHAVTVSAPASDAPLAGLRFRQTLDIEEHAQAMSGWQLRYDQLTAGRFSGELTELRLGSMQLIRDRANQSMAKNGAAWPGSIGFSMPLRSRDPQFHCMGHSIIEPSLLVARADHLPEVQVPAGLDLVCVSIDEQGLQDVLQRQNRAFDLARLPRCYSGLAGTGPQELIRLFSRVLDQCSETAALLGHAAIRDGIHDTVLLHLLDLIDSAEERPLVPSARKRMVDRAREYAMAKREQPPTVLELCNQIGASRRKLQYCFQETLGTNPVAYLRALRLNAAHRQLRSGVSTDSVQSVAAHWGFWHLSRFANDYRQLFGELPSDTLRRARGDSADFG
jgi:AraC family transcriptional regulator, ethanolamine operon transcriptional activator